MITTELRICKRGNFRICFFKDYPRRPRQANVKSYYRLTSALLRVGQTPFYHLFLSGLALSNYPLQLTISSSHRIKKAGLKSRLLGRGGLRLFILIAVVSQIRDEAPEAFVKRNLRTPTQNLLGLPAGYTNPVDLPRPERFAEGRYFISRERR